MPFIPLADLGRLLAILGALALPLIAQTPSKIDLELRRQIESNAGDELIAAYVHFGPKLDVEKHLERARALPRKERRAFALGLARDHADRLQAEALEYLRAAESEGAASKIRQLWINNVLSLRATPEVIAGIAKFDGVVSLHPSRRVPVEEVVDGASSARSEQPLRAAAGGGISPHLTAIQAPDVWNLGYRGQGVRVAVVDGKFQYDHPDLLGALWTNDFEIAGNGIDDDNNGYIDDIVGWDFVDGDNQPYTNTVVQNDIDAHGTMVAGNIVGDGTSGTTTGVAPEAELIYLAVSGGTESDYWASYQYALSANADLISSSSSLKFPSTPDYAGFRAAAETTLLAGVLHLNSVGNQGAQLSSHPIPFNISTPGNCPPPWKPLGSPVGGFSAVLGVGAIAQATNGIFDLPTTYSGKGPASWTQSDATSALGSTWPTSFAPFNDYPFFGGFQPGLPKPDLVAPAGLGVFTTTSDYLNGSPGTYYSEWAGTSAAQPQVAGLAALLLSIDDDLAPADLARFILTGADDLGPSGQDNDFGFGRLNCLASAQQALNNLHRLTSQDIFMLTDGSNTPSPLSLHRSRQPIRYVFPTPGDGVPFPSSFGNGAVEHVDDTTYLLVGQGNAPYGLYLLDFSTGITTPTSYHLGNATGPIFGIAFDVASGNTYFTSNTDLRVINGPLETTSSIAALPAAQPGILFTSGIAIEGSGNVFVGANQSAVYRFAVGTSGATPLVTSGGITSIAANRRTGDFFVTQFTTNVVHQYDHDGNLLATLSSATVDGPIAVELRQDAPIPLVISRNATSTTSPVDNQIHLMFTTGSNPTIYGLDPHFNLGDHATIAAVGGAGYDPSFELGGFFDTRIRGPWLSSTGTLNRRRSLSSCLPLFAPFPLNGGYGLFVSAEGTFDATPPNGTGTFSPRSEVSTSFSYNPARPRLSFSFAFINGEGLPELTYNDFGGVYLTTADGSRTVLVQRNTLSFVDATSDPTCALPSEPMMYGNVDVNLDDLGLGLVPGSRFSLTVYCGNVSDGQHSSAVIVDHIQLRPETFELRTEVVAPGVLRFAYDNATPGSLVVTFVAVDEPAAPRGSGPILGIGLSALSILQSPGAPFYTVPDAAGSYSQTFGGIPSGFILESCAVEFLLGVPGEFSNIAGPLFIF